MSPQITASDKKPGRDTQRKTIVAQTTDKKRNLIESYMWWMAQSDNDLCQQTIATGNYLQKIQAYKVKGASVFSRLYSNKGLMNYALNSKIIDPANQLPIRTPTMNVIQSGIDTLVSRMTQSKPKPSFYTDYGYYKEQQLALRLNQFIAGEFYRTKAYEKGTSALRDACIFGDGFIKVYPMDNKVTLERILTTEIFADKDDSWYGEPRQLFQFKLCDRNVLVGQFPKAQLEIAKAQRAYVDGSGESSETISDQIICMEAWHRRSFDGAKDGRHVIVCSEGVILDEAWEKDQFPFVKMSYNPHPVGYFSQGAAEQIMGTQLAINKLLSTIEEAMHKIAVPRIFLDELSKVTESSINNNVGTIIKFRGQPPQFSVSPVMPPESYQHLERLIGYAYQQLGISQLAASSQKPAGLNSGEAQRVFLENQDTRFEALETRYNDFYVALAYQMIDMAKDIAKETGEYLTVYPDKDGTREVDLPKAEILKDYYVIQCLEESSLPREPGGRYAQLSEMLASNEITLSEFRALQQMPDLKKADEMANALRDRITDILDSIVEKNTDPVADEFLLDPANTATQMTVQYINRYTIADLEESKLQKMRDFLTQIETLKSQATAPPPQPMPEPGQAQGNPNQAPPPAAPPTPNSLVSAV